MPQFKNLCRQTIYTLVLGLALQWVTISNTASATAVSFDFSGVITSKDDAESFLGSGFTPGTPFTGNLTFDTTSASTDIYPGDPTLGLFAFPFPTTPGGDKYNLTITAGADTFGSLWGLITVENAPYAHIDYGAILQSYDGVNLAPTFTASSYALSMTQTDPSVFGLASDQIPLVPPDLADYDTTTIAIGAQDPTRGIEFIVYGTVTSITPVPEPNAESLAAVGLVCLLAARFARKGLVAGRSLK